MLAAPPAAAMTYVKPSSGLEPSVYGGGGSPSSRSLLPAGPSFVSRGSAALVSATTELAALAKGVTSGDSSNAGGGRGGRRLGSLGAGSARAVSDSDSERVTSSLYGSTDEGAGK